MGGNPAENHPCGFKWAIEAKVHRNAKTIVVDPRLTRTAANADMYVQIRAGADIAFLGGLIRYAIENNRIAKDYLVNYTNAAFIIKDGFKLPEDGLFSGFDPEKKIYDKKTWNYEEGGDLTGKPVAGTPADKRSSFAPGGDAAAACASPEDRVRSLASTSALRLSTTEEAIRALHARNGRAHYRHSAGSIPQCRRPLHLRPQRRRHEKSRHHYLCGRLDAAQLRHPDHPHRRRPAIAHGQRRPRRWRGQRASRPLQHPGRYRYGGNLRHSPGVLEDAESHRRRPRHLFEAHYATAVQARSVGLVQLLVEHAKICRLIPQGDVRTSSYQRKRLGLPLSAEDRPQLFLGEHLERHVRGQDQRAFSPSG